MSTLFRLFDKMFKREAGYLSVYTTNIRYKLTGSIAEDIVERERLIKEYMKERGENYRKLGERMFAPRKDDFDRPFVSRFMKSRSRICPDIETMKDKYPIIKGIARIPLNTCATCQHRTRVSRKRYACKLWYEKEKGLVKEVVTEANKKVKEFFK